MKRRVRRHEVTQPQDPSYRLIPLTQGQNAIVDASDFEWLNQWNWVAQWTSCTRSFYAYRSIVHGERALHRLIAGGYADHRNHDTLDNRRDNLRRCTHAENLRNQSIRQGKKDSKFKGVTRSYGERWCSRISIDGKHIYLGYFKTQEAAALAYDFAARRFHREFAHFNLVTDWYTGFE